MKRLFFALIAIGLMGTACEKNKNTHAEDIIGKWKLVEVSINKNFDYENREIIDYSSNNIIYEFLSDNKLIITGSVPDSLSLFDDFKEGVHFYDYRKPDFTCAPAPNLSIAISDINRQGKHYCCDAPLDKQTMGIGNLGKTIEGNSYRWSKKFIKIK